MKKGEEKVIMSVENIHLLRIIIICAAAAIEVVLGVLVVLAIRKSKKQQTAEMQTASMASYAPNDNPMQAQVVQGGFAPNVQQPAAPGMQFNGGMTQQNDYMSSMPQEMPYAPNVQMGHVDMAQMNHEKKWYIEGISGFLNGQKIEINGKLCMGRQAEQCQASFPVDYKGISGRHCELSVTPQGVYLMDCGSSYGTFTESQGKLMAEQPVLLQEGQTFYLANQQEMFRLIRI